MVFAELLIWTFSGVMRNILRYEAIGMQVRSS